MTGKLLSVATALFHCMTRMTPLSCMVSPLMKCATTSMTKYPMDINAMTLVYFKESKRRKNDSGITMSLWQERSAHARLQNHPTEQADVRSLQKDSHECSNPKKPIHKKSHIPSILAEPPDNTGHEVANDNQIAHADPKTLDRDGGIEDNRRIGVRNLREREEGSRATVQVSRAASLQVQPEARGQARPDDDEAAEQDAHAGEGEGHSQDAGADDCSGVSSLGCCCVCFLLGSRGEGRTGVYEVDDAAEPAGLADHADFFSASSGPLAVGDD